MGKFLAKLTALTLSLSLCLTLTAGAVSFPDVDGKTPQGKAIEFLALCGVLNGTSDGSFQPDKTITRAELTKIIFYLQGYGTAEQGDARYWRVEAEQFSDVPQDAWYSMYVGYCVSYNIAGGVGGGRFAPNEVVSMAQAVKMCYNTLAYMDGEKPGYSYPQGFLDAAQKAGYFADMGQIIPDAPITRGQVAQLCYNGLWSRHTVWESVTPDGSTVTGFQLSIPASYGLEQERNAIMGPADCPFTVTIHLSAPASDVSLRWVTTGWDGDPEIDMTEQLKTLVIKSFQKTNDTQYEAVVDFPDGFNYTHGILVGKFVASANGQEYDSATYTAFYRGGGGK